MFDDINPLDSRGFTLYVCQSRRRNLLRGKAITLNEFRGAEIDTAGRNRTAEEMGTEMGVPYEELETLEELHDQAAERGRAEPDVPWYESDDNEHQLPGAALLIEQAPFGKGTELVVTSVDSNQSGFQNYWDIEPTLPPQPEVPDTRTTEPGNHEEDLSKTQTKLERFSNLTDTLRKIEAKHIEAGPSRKEAIAEARIAVMRAIKEFNFSRFELGKALSAYRAHFKAARGWMVAAASIAAAMGCDERTVRNIIADYEHVARVPEAVIHAAQAKGIDLSQRKYRPAVVAIESAIGNPDEGRDALDADEANRIISNVLVMPPPVQREHGHDERFVPLTREEKLHFAVRMKIRTALTNTENDRKLPVLLQALEEEMFDVWGFTGPVTVTITPRTSGLTLDGRRRREEVA